MAPSFPNPSSAVLGGYSFSTAANDEAGGFDINPFTPGASPTVGSVASAPMLAGPGGFLRPGLTAQNILTDPNVGLGGSGMPSFGGASLSNPLVGGFPFGKMDEGLGGC